MKKHSFTLIEMLVVVGIIAVLAGLVMPAIGHARTTAKRTACLSNQGQTMKIVAQAMNDNKQYLVSGNNFADSPGYRPGWTRYLYGEGTDTSGRMAGKRSYLQNLTAFRCPSFQYAEKQELGALTDTKRATALGQAYGMMYQSGVDEDASLATDAAFYGFDFRGTKYLKTSTYQVSPGSLVLGGCAVVTSSPYDTAKSLLCNNSTWNGKFVKIHGDFTNAFALDGHADSLDKKNFESRYYPGSNSAAQLSSSGWLDPED